MHNYLAMLTTTEKILTSARDRISQGFTKGEYARNSAGLPVQPRGAQATCFCSLGAIERGLEDNILDRHVYLARSEAKSHLQAVVLNLTGLSDIVAFNDDPRRTQKEVVRAFDSAIERVQKARNAFK